MPHMYPKACRVKISPTPLRRNTWKLRPHRGTTLGPLLDNTLPTAPNSMQHACSALSRSLLSIDVMLPLKRPITKYLWTMLFINQDIGASLGYRQLIQDGATFLVWNKAAANEFGRLAQGVGGCIEVSNTIFFIPRHAVPKRKVATYGRFVVDIRPNKPELNHVYLTVGGNLIHYPGGVSKSSAYLTTSKCICCQYVQLIKSTVTDSLWELQVRSCANGAHMIECACGHY
jgi:hypothetical protein